MSVTFFCPAEPSEISFYTCQCQDGDWPTQATCPLCAGAGVQSFSYQPHSINVSIFNYHSLLQLMSLEDKEYGEIPISQIPSVIETVQDRLDLGQPWVSSHTTEPCEGYLLAKGEDLLDLLKLSLSLKSPLIWS